MQPQIPDFIVPSQANFVLVRLGERATRTKDVLRRQGILIRDRSYELPGCVRVTVGGMPQMRRLMRELLAVMK